MNETEPSSSESPPPRKIGWLVALLGLSIIALATTVGLWRAQRGKPREVVVEMVRAEAPEESPEVYTAEVIDAITRRDIKAEIGRRYKVVIEDESKEGSAGIARIGGLVTFVQDAEVGDIAIVEVLRLKKTSAEARIIRRVETAKPTERPRARAQTATRRREESPVQVGGVYTGVVEDVGRKGDGIVRVEGKVVFLSGVQKGQRVVFRVVENNDRFATAEQVEEGTAAAVGSEQGQVESTGAEANAGLAQDDESVREGESSEAEDVQVGRRFIVTVTEKDRKDPDRNGVARIGGLVVFVPDSQPGQRVVIRIVERRPRFARSEVIERKEAAASLP